MTSKGVEVAEDVDLSYLDHPKSTYTREKKIEVCATYLLSGNVYQTAISCGVPRVLVSDWKTRSAWWDQLVEDLRKQKQDDLDAVLTCLIDDLTGKLNQRLDQGDPYVKKDGTIGYIPVKTKDLAVTMAVLYDKRALIRGEATSIRTDSNTSLKALENRFKEFTTSLKEKDVVAEQ